MQSNLAAKPQAAKLHVGIIMDGNGRWATRRGLSRLRGHEAGVEAIRRVVEAAPDQGVGTLTLYAFSSDNWRRPRAEVTALMGLLRFYLANEIEALVRNGVRLTVIGRRDRLPDGMANAIARGRSRSGERRWRTSAISLATGLRAFVAGKRVAFRHPSRAGCDRGLDAAEQAPEREADLRLLRAPYPYGGRQ